MKLTKGSCEYSVLPRIHYELHTVLYLFKICILSNHSEGKIMLDSNKINKALAQRAYLQHAMLCHYYHYINHYNCVNIFQLKSLALFKVPFVAYIMFISLVLLGRYLSKTVRKY